MAPTKNVQGARFHKVAARVKGVSWFDVGVWERDLFGLRVVPLVPKVCNWYIQYSRGFTNYPYYFGGSLL